MGDGKGSKSTSYNYDPESSRRLAAVSERQQSLAEQAFGDYKSIFQPYEKASIDSYMQMLPGQTQYAIDQQAAEQSLLGDRTAATKAGLQEMVHDIEGDRAVKDAMRAEGLKEIERSSPVADKFYKEALDGVQADYAGVTGRAQSDVAQAYGQADAINRRGLSRMGVNASSGRGVAQMAQMALARAKDTAAAKTSSREGERQRVEDTNFSRLQSAMAAKGNPSLPGIGSTGTGGSSVATPDGSLNSERIGIDNPANRGVALLGQAGSSAGVLASRPTSTTQSGGGGAMGFLGQAAGMGLGAMAGNFGASAGTAAFAMLSSLRFKQNVEPLDVDPLKLLELRPVRFEYKSSPGESQIGFIAEEVADILPDVVHMDDQGRPHSLALDRLLALTVGAVKALKIEIDEIKSAMAEHGMEASNA